MPPGLECYKSVKKTSDKCLIPCKGVFADVEKGEDYKQVEAIEKFRATLHNYEDYKSGFITRNEGK